MSRVSQIATSVTVAAGLAAEPAAALLAARSGCPLESPERPGGSETQICAEARVAFDRLCCPALQADIRLLPWTLPPMFIAPPERSPTLRQPPVHDPRARATATGYACVAIVASTGVDYLQLGAAFTTAGIGTSFCFPTVAAAIIGSIPIEEAGSRVRGQQRDP